MPSNWPLEAQTAAGTQQTQQQGICKECMMANQEKQGEYSTVIKAVQQKENTLSSKVSELPQIKGLKRRRQERRALQTTPSVTSRLNVKED